MKVVIFLFILGLAAFSYCACVVSSGCSRYEDYRRKNDEDE